MVESLIVSTSFPYNCILERPALNQLQAKVFTCDLSMEIPIGEEVHSIYGDQKATQEFYIATVKEVERMEQESEESTKILKLDAQHLNRTVKISQTLPVSLCM